MVDGTYGGYIVSDGGYMVRSVVSDRGYETELYISLQQLHLFIIYFYICFIQHNESK